MSFPKWVQFHILSIPEEKEGDWRDYRRGTTKVIGEKYELTEIIRENKGYLPSVGISSSSTLTICFMRALCAENEIELSDSEYISI